MLVGYFCTATARLAASLSDAEVAQVAVAQLQSMFGEVSAILEMKRSCWERDQFACGAYSFNAIGSNARHRRALAEPTGRLIFAGEHTHEDFFATVHGALLSGRRAAETLLSEKS